jgi:hypothetical protein
MSPEQRKREKDWRRRGIRWTGKPFTCEHRELLVSHQGEKCFVCGREDADKSGRALHVDHDHETGEARGLLCTFCNRILGIKGLAPRLRKMARYHSRPPARQIQESNSNEWGDQ